MKIKRVGVMSCAKISGTLYLLVGLIFGAIFALIGLAGFTASRMGGLDSAPSIVQALFGVGALVILPIFYGAMGFIGGLIGAALYNLLARIVGGIELDLE